MRKREMFERLSCGWKMGAAALLLWVATTVVTQAQTFTTLVNFNGAIGSSPNSSLVQGIDGNFYGTTEFDGAYGGGTVFKMTSAGTLTTLYNFCAQPNCADGANPSGALLLGLDGKFYGTTAAGGGGSCEIYQQTGCGTVFKITPAGKLTTLYNFCAQANCPDGHYPNAPLLQATDGKFYGTTQFGGSANCNSGCGTLFNVTPAGTLTTLHTFCSQTGCGDGKYPDGGLLQGTNGSLYGTTLKGGVGCSCGLVFAITLQGSFSRVYLFRSAFDGSLPNGGLIQATDGNLYGTTYAGGECGGVVFKITSQGETTLSDSCFGPEAGLVQGTDGNLYGTTALGGDPSCDGGDGCGTLFEVTLLGTLTTLHTFEFTDGEYPEAALLQATNGILYGTTAGGGNSENCGPSGCGTVFSLDMGLGPFVSFVRNPAKVGQTFGVLGQDLSGTTSVSLNGTPASFKVVLGTFLEATVPAGATTGYLTVTTPTGVLTSNVPFRVLP